MFRKSLFQWLSTQLFDITSLTPEHYTVLRRNIVITMMAVTIFPLGAMTVINHFQYRARLKNEITTPLIALANKTKHSMELFLKERLSTVRFIATAYSYEEISQEQNIKRTLNYLKKELGGFVDLGLINAKGDLVSYAGPYALLGKNYSKQTSFQETLIKGHYISNVFMGHRKFPHIVIAVQRLADDGKMWILRATIDTDRFDNLITSMGLDPQSDAFLVDGDGVFQTSSKHYGRVLEKCPVPIPFGRFQADIFETSDNNDKQIMVASIGFSSANYILIVVKPLSVILKSWYTLKTELFMVFAISLALILGAVIKITGVMVEKIKESDEKREDALTELQHNQKLSSIGRLAAGVAHEINNPLAIINEKAGLMNDLIEFSNKFEKNKFMQLTSSVIQSVERCSTITHRMLGFAKRIDICIENIDINNVINDVIGFVDREALYRKINLKLELHSNLNRISSDQGQLQQVFLNLLTNAFAAVEDGGNIAITTDNNLDGGIIVRFTDNGSGIPEDAIIHIFDPFFSTKKGAGTGLGLSITYGIIKKLGGSITVSSQENYATTFTIVLPEKLEILMEDSNEP